MRISVPKAMDKSKERKQRPPMFFFIRIIGMISVNHRGAQGMTVSQLNKHIGGRPISVLYIFSHIIANIRTAMVT